ncbi:MAG TPA: tail fiber domain-containing protein [Thermoanaerobaculia bacterium]|nr:tail fiber domain-containing protein [Thermoanaerobaculia bacterium]
MLRQHRSRFLGSILVLSLLLPAAPGWAQGPHSSTFTYQGLLRQGSDVADGLYDFVVSLYDDADATNLLATTTVLDVPVRKGLFVLQLDLGDTVFSGEPRWLEIQTGQAGSGELEALRPLQLLTAAPYAIFSDKARAARVADTLSGYGAADFLRITGGTLRGGLEVEGPVRSSDGGFEFPDGTTQMTAAATTLDWQAITGIPPGFADGDDAVGVVTEADPTVATSVKDGVAWSELAGIPAGFADGDDAVGVATEEDPTVAASVKDGVAWNELAGIPAGFADGDDAVGVTTESDPTVAVSVKDGVAWNELAGIPAGFADGDDAVGLATETDPTVAASVKDGVSWNEVAGIPGGFADGDDAVGLTAETDPTVPASLKDGVSWNELAGIPGGFSDGVDNTGIATESDPTVAAHVKDGISWGELAGVPAGFADGTDDAAGAWSQIIGIPAGFADGVDNAAGSWSEISGVPAGFADGIDHTGIATESDPTVPAHVKDGISWGELASVPAGFADGTDDTAGAWSQITGIPAGFADGVDNAAGSWSEISGVPAGFADGIDHTGLTAEVDPEVGFQNPQYVPLWNGSQLVSGSIRDNGSGNVMIGTGVPRSSLHIHGSNTGIAFSDPTDQLADPNNRWELFGADSLGRFMVTRNNATAFVMTANLQTVSFPNANSNVDIAGRLGVGTVPGSSYKLHVNGETFLNGRLFYLPPGGCSSGQVLAVAPEFGYAIYCANVSSLPSDARWKISRGRITDGLALVRGLEGIRYEWDRARFPERQFPAGTEVGFLAQEVERVVPEVVHTDAQGNKSVDYAKLTAVLVEAVKEQQGLLEELASRVRQLEAAAEK